jgi:2-succinyl-6-hydroxy-2,4-cyclohexadiene-1-carboxylate synthase
MTTRWHRGGESMGTSLALLHGFLGHPQTWQRTLAGSRKTWDLAHAVLPGHGPQPWLAAQPTWDIAIDALAEALPFDKPVWILGYSMGARVGLGLAVRHPQRVAGLVLVGGSPGLGDEQQRAERRVWDEAQAMTLEHQGLQAFVEMWERLPLWSTQTRVPEPVRSAHRERRLAHTPSGLAWAMRVLGLASMPNLSRDLPQLNLPIHWWTGEFDTHAHAIASVAAPLSPQGSHRTFAGVGHDLTLEAPLALAAALDAAIGGT